MKAPKVSIILSSYNHEKFIAATIQSVLDQEFCDFELIVIDDASTDKSQDIILTFTDSRIQTLFFQCNSGLSAVLNQGISIANGEYIARIDSDDYWEKDKLKKQIEYLDEHSEIGACFTWVHFIDGDGRSHTKDTCNRLDVFEVNNRTREEWLKHFYFVGSCLCHPSAVIRKKVLDIVGSYNCMLRQLQDFDLWIRIVKKYDIYIICEPLVNYRWLTGENQNTCAPNPIGIRRARYEFYQIFSQYFDDIDDTMFSIIFCDHFQKSESITHEELLCERAMILLQPNCFSDDTKLMGFEKINQLFQIETTKNLLEKSYGVTPNFMYNLTASKVFYEYREDDDMFLVQQSDMSLTFKNLLKNKLRNHNRLYQFTKKCYYFFVGK